MVLGSSLAKVEPFGGGSVENRFVNHTKAIFDDG